MKNKLIIIIILILLVGGISVYFILDKEEKALGEKENIMASLSNKKIAIIIAYQDFKDEEYFTPAGVLEKTGVEIKVVSDNSGIAQGADGGEVNVDIKLSDLKVDDFDAIVFIGGPGALNHLDNQDSYRIAKEAISQNKLLSAICISPAILAKAGVLNGKKATVWTSALDKSAAKILENNGAIYQKESMVQDGNIITANGPDAAGDFANAIINYLSTKKY